MNNRLRNVYLISDLHLGGAQPRGGDPEDRGFRICTHGDDLARFITALAAKPDPVELVINGDTVDFLAEPDENGGWSAFTSDERDATRKLDRIIDGERDVFQAIRALIGCGHRLTLLIGNHDIELALPAVRQRLRDRIGITGRHDFHFIYDGEAYVVGRVLVEHGNRYDPFNVVDHDALRRIRSLRSRQQPIIQQYAFEAPAGSRIVAEVMNPIKADYRIIDLLKPETGAMLPVLMTLEPGYRSVLSRIAMLGLKARRHRLAADALPSFAGDISSNAGESWVADTTADPLAVIVREIMQDDAELVLNAVPAEPAFVGDMASRGPIDRTLGVARLLAAGRRSTIESRLPALLAAVRSLQHDASFARDAECFAEYLSAARDLAGHGFDAVVFGHTHLARDIALPGGARYLNSGTWADMIRFPADILSASDRLAIDALRAFLEDMRAGRLRAWTSFIPTYVKLTIGDDNVVRDAALHDFTTADGI